MPSSNISIPVGKDAAAEQKGLEISVSMVVISGLIIIGIVAAVIVCYYLARRMHREFDAPRVDMLILLSDKENTMIPSTIREKCRTVISYLPSQIHNQTAIDKFLAGIKNVPLEKTESESGETEIVQGAGDNGTLPIRKDSRLHFLEHATNLHISKLEDFYGNRILLAAAPLKSQFIDHWEAIWRQSVGVVVWVGRMVVGKEKRIDPYIGFVENGNVRHGPFTITTLYSAKRYMEYDTFQVLVERTGREGKRKITFIHAPHWQQSSVSWSLQKDVDLISAIKTEHVNHIGAGLPVMMFQCKFGTAGSATLLAVYIGYQMWSRSKQVNLYGILRYVRRRRWMAFEQTGDENYSFLTQVQIAYAVMYAVAKWHETGKVLACEKWIKNILTERGSISVSGSAGSTREQKKPSASPSPSL